MQRRRFGTTSLELPEFCFGTMRFADRTPGDDARTHAGQRALEEALDLGIDFVHSSYEHGTRWSTGEVLARHPRRDRVRHAIKVNVPAWGEPQFNPVAFRRQVEGALRDLRSDRIDIVQHLQRGDFERMLGYDDRAEPSRAAPRRAATQRPHAQTRLRPRLRPARPSPRHRRPRDRRGRHRDVMDGLRPEVFPHRPDHCAEHGVRADGAGVPEYER